MPFSALSWNPLAAARFALLPGPCGVPYPEATLLRKARFILVAAVPLAVALASCGDPGSVDLVAGSEIYDTCVPCHGENGAGDVVLHAPPIAGLPEWYLVEQLTKFKADMRGAHPDDIEGHRMRPMARTLSSEAQIASVSKHVAGLPAVHSAETLTGGDAAAGADLYNGICVACHGADAKGNVDMKAPPLVGQADWYMVSQLHKYKDGLRGAHPDDVWGGTMRAMSMTLEDEQAMKNVVAHIRSLPR